MPLSTGASVRIEADITLRPIGAWRALAAEITAKLPLMLSRSAAPILAAAKMTPPTPRVTGTLVRSIISEVNSERLTAWIGVPNLPDAGGPPAGHAPASQYAAVVEARHHFVIRSFEAMKDQMVDVFEADLNAIILKHSGSVPA